MTYIRLSSKQLDTLRGLPTNLNDNITSHNVGGILVLNKMSEIKQIMIDFQSYHMDELFIKRHDNKVHILEHIKNKDPRNNFVFSFEIENALKKRSSDQEFSSYFFPDIYQWIKCVIYSIYREVQNHLVFTASGKIFVISMRKDYYTRLLRRKHMEKTKIREMYHILFSEYIEYYKFMKRTCKSITSIPTELKELFIIRELACNSLNFNYTSYNPLLVISKS